jgi:hypothetical protein
MAKSYWVVMFDRDGGEQDPEGPFECRDDGADEAYEAWRDA